MRLCLFQPEIPQNTGTLLRMAACLGLGVDIIEPCGFIISDRKLRRAGMDYIDHVDLKFYVNWETYLDSHPSGRIIALEPGASLSYVHFKFSKEDILLLGQEAKGIPPNILSHLLHQIKIPMQPGLRSLNVAVAGAMVVGEALRQTSFLPLFLTNDNVTPS